MAKNIVCCHSEKMALGEVIELVLVDEGKAMNNNHPMHLHGHSFRVVAMEKVNIFLMTPIGNRF
jgi:FtsP/CotA-like multicopper oxidase with cupredoxin domain